MKTKLYIFLLLFLFISKGIIVAQTISGELNPIINKSYVYTTTGTYCSWSISGHPECGVIEQSSYTQSTVRWTCLGPNTIKVWCYMGSNNQLDVNVLSTGKVQITYDKKLEYSYTAAGQRRLRKEIVLQSSQWITKSRLKSDNETEEALAASQAVIDDTDSTITVKLWPNPVQKSLQLQLLCKNEKMPSASIQVTTTSGAILQTLQTQTGALDIDMSAYNAGYYILNINYNDKASNWTVIKQ